VKCWKMSTVCRLCVEGVEGVYVVVGGLVSPVKVFVDSSSVGGGCTKC
jgi:hypothetical protein